MKSLKAVLLGLSVWILIYFVGCFIAWEINPGKWRADARAAVGLMGFIISVAAAAMYRIGDKMDL